jgi:hypothetical protein
VINESRTVVQGTSLNLRQARCEPASIVFPTYILVGVPPYYSPYLNRKRTRPMRNPSAGMYAVANSKFSPGAGEPGEAVWGSPHGETMDYYPWSHGLGREKKVGSGT